MARFVAALSVALLVAGGSTSAQRQPAAGEVGPFVGTYGSASVERDARVIDDAIVGGTEAMGPLRRAVARRRLASTNRPVRALQIVTEGPLLVTRWDGAPYPAPLDGTWQRGVDPDGKAVNVSYAVRDGQLIARYVGSDGEKRVTFTLLEGGRRLCVAVLLLSDQLPAPIRYRLTYLRRGS